MYIIYTTLDRLITFCTELHILFRAFERIFFARLCTNLETIPRVSPYDVSRDPLSTRVETLKHFYKEKRTYL